jgi:hypothetical protein
MPIQTTALMAAQSPEAWRDLKAAAELLTPDNRAAVAACRDATGKCSALCEARYRCCICCTFSLASACLR